MTMKIIETDRLILRTWEDNDIDLMAIIDQDLKVCEYLPGIGNRVATTTGIQRIIEHYHTHGFSVYAVELKATHKFIGYIGLMITDFISHFTPAVEIEWRLASQHWGYGYATEGAKAVLDYGFDILKLNEIVSFTVPGNI